MSADVLGGEVGFLGLCKIEWKGKKVQNKIYCLKIGKLIEILKEKGNDLIVMNNLVRNVIFFLGGA